MTAQRSMTDEQMLAKYGYDEAPYEYGGRRYAKPDHAPVPTELLHFAPRPECIPSRYVAYLTLGSYSRVWRGVALDWDDACSRAEKANPKWDVHTCGLDVQNGRPPVNPILSAFRDERHGPWMSAENRVEEIRAWVKWHCNPVNGATDEQVDFARRVLTRLRDLTEAGK